MELLINGEMNLDEMTYGNQFHIEPVTTLGVGQVVHVLDFVGVRTGELERFVGQSRVVLVLAAQVEAGLDQWNALETGGCNEVIVRE